MKIRIYYLEILVFSIIFNKQEINNITFFFYCWFLNIQTQDKNVTVQSQVLSSNNLSVFFAVVFPPALNFEALFRISNAAM